MKLWWITYINPIGKESRSLKIASSQRQAIKFLEKTLKRSPKIVKVEEKNFTLWN
jgi:hypothetical protein